MKKQILDFTVSVRYVGEKSNNWADAWQHNVVSVKLGKKKTNFDYWGSKVKPHIEAKDLDDCLYAIVSDAQIGEGSFEDFISEFGYSGDKDDEKTYKACQNIARKLRRLVEGTEYNVSMSDLYNMINEHLETLEAED